MELSLTASHVALFSLACLSCTASFTPTELTGASSGTRLRAWVEEGGGVRLFDGWHDTALDLDCEFKTATDGQLRCLPLRSGSQVLYADRDCATPIFAENWSAESLETTPRWVITGSAGPTVCGGAVDTVVTEVRALGDAIPTPAAETPVYFRSGSGSDLLCGPARTPSPTARYYALGAIEAPESFVAATRVVEAHAGLFDQSVIVAEDGAREAAGLVAHATGAVCGIRTIREQERCVLFSTVENIGIWFADAACSVHAGFAYPWSGDCGPPRLFVVDDYGAECPTHHAYEVGEPLASPFFATSDGCVEGSGFGGADMYFGSGPEITGSALDALAPVVTRASIGTGALRAEEWVDAEGALLMPTYEPWHLADGTPCTPQEHAGARVCGPAATTTYSFADAACSVPLVPPHYFCVDPMPTVIAVPAEEAFREVGAEYAGTNVYVSFGGRCSASSGSRTGYRTLGPITTGTFPAMSRRLD